MARKTKVNEETKTYEFKGSNTTVTNKRAFLACFRKSYHISDSCEAAGIVRKTFYTWLTDDAEFNSAYEELQEKRIDDAERSLSAAVNLMDSQSIKFFLSRKGKKRGYGDEDVNLKHSGNLIIKWADEDENE